MRFISNENFSAVVNAQNEWEYFRDFFAVRQGLRIGHTTKKGSELIAVNVVKEFRDHWTELGLPPLRRTR